MKVKHFEITPPSNDPPQAEGWVPTWYGYHEMEKIETPERRREAEAQKQAAHADGMITEEEFERDCLFSILQEINTEKVDVFELGAGWGRISLALAGAIDFKLVPMKVNKYRFLAIEAEPSHFQWTKEHFEQQGINGMVLHAAVSDKNGYCRFPTFQEPEMYYGQGINRFFLRKGIPNIGSFRNFFSRKTIKVPAYTVDQLMADHDFDKVDIIDVDVQGAECDVVQGAAGAIRDKRIRYWLIGTHGHELNDRLEEMLSADYDLIVNVYPRSVNDIEGIPRFQCHDGVQLYQIKE